MESKKFNHKDLGSVTLPYTSTADCKGHIVVIGDWRDITLFVAHIRSFHLKSESVIVALSQNLPDETQWRQISWLDNIMVVQGSPVNIDDLERVNIGDASKVVILGDGRSSETSVDAKSIMLFNFIRRAHPFPIVDLVHLSNSKYLGEGNTGDELENLYYAAGQVYASSCQETLMCQIYFNKYIVSVYEQMTSGRVFGVNLSKMFFTEDKLWINFFRRCLACGYLPLGVYRHGSTGRYVVTNPSKDLKLITDGQDADIVLLILPDTESVPMDRTVETPMQRAKSHTLLLASITKSREMLAENKELVEKDKKTKKEKKHKKEEKTTKEDANDIELATRKDKGLESGESSNED